MNPHFHLLVVGLLASAAASAQDDISRCVSNLREPALRSGVSAAGFDKFTGDFVPEPGVLKLLDNQPEFKTPIWDYLASLVDDERVADGRAMLAQHQATLAAVAQRHGVEPETVVAVWGVESNFGRSIGKRPLVQSLGTLACAGRRQDYFRGEFLALLKLLDRGDVLPEQAVGSWAGAFGHTQFMPSTYQRLAVDFDGDGRRDLVASIPDALASTANFLSRGGYKAGQPWGYEVVLPAGFDAAVAGRRNKRALDQWRAAGLKPTAGGELSGPGPAGLLLPAGPKGPAFLVFGNFDSIYGYNAAESYALAIAHLADRLKGGGPFATAWPTDDAGLSREQRREVQLLLAARGHPIGEVDGMLGSASRTAIKAEQQRLGLPADGRAGLKLLKALRNP